MRVSPINFMNFNGGAEPHPAAKPKHRLPARSRTMVALSKFEGGQTPSKFSTSLWMAAISETF
jgi:hypothetical protein